MSLDFCVGKSRIYIFLQTSSQLTFHVLYVSPHLSFINQVFCYFVDSSQCQLTV